MRHLAVLPCSEEQLPLLLTDELEIVRREPGLLEVRSGEQLVEIHEVRLFGEARLLLVADVAGLEVLGAEAALAHNATMAFGALAAREGRCIAQAMLARHGLTVAELVRAIDVLVAGDTGDERGGSAAQRPARARQPRAGPGDPRRAGRGRARAGRRPPPRDPPERRDLRADHARSRRAARRRRRCHGEQVAANQQAMGAAHHRAHR